ncbi:hypothetical protein Sme01_57330 [Sphaerisporangium melleum]|uniref:DUF2690 domain-containing protein n=1 Tax=Sphaerisporangium melleum TaxID=321316 RepID=A0A917VM03_9ACTN|nr:hypothetical protein [Sphaerisporangium melleum]GGK94561.1 hypothetical protein GCM10007964_41210 [Sphaerisporangium melleum]GII73257.1 hypothetical protein Sme01_57330 [Sphaerisporangium melleum]
MIVRRRISVFALAAVCAAVPLTSFSASAAQAGTASKAGFGPTKCTNIGNGDLCTTGISGSPAGYDVAYNKRSGSTVTVRFRLQCVGGYKAADNGAFNISAGQRKSFVFSVGNKGQCQSVLQDITNGKNFYGPYVTIP